MLSGHAEGIRVTQINVCDIVKIISTLLITGFADSFIVFGAQFKYSFQPTCSHTFSR